MLNNNNVYATFEVQSDGYVLNVIKFIGSKSISLFNQKISVTNKTFNEIDGSLMDVEQASNCLKKLINNFNLNTKFMKIERIAFVIPTIAIKVKTKFIKIDINSSEKLTGLKFDENAIRMIYKKAKISDENVKIIDSKIEKMFIDDIECFADSNTFRSDLIGKEIKYDFHAIAIVNEIDKKIYDQYENIFIENDVQVGMVSSKMKSLFQNISFDDQYNSFVNTGKIRKNSSKNKMIINWEEDFIEAGFFRNGILVETKVVNKGIKNIVSEFSKILSFKNENIAKQYIFSLLNYNTPYNSNTEVYTSKGRKLVATFFDLKQIISKLLVSYFKEIKSSFKTEDIQKMNVATYNFGLVNEIPGSEEMIKDSEGGIIANVFKFHEPLMGMKKGLSFASSLGVLKIYHLEQLTSKKKSPSIIFENLQNTQNEVHVQTQQEFMPNLQRNIRPQYFKTNDVIIDKNKLLIRENKNVRFTIK